MSHGILKSYTEVSLFKYWAIPIASILIGRIYRQGTSVYEDDAGTILKREYYIKRIL